MKAWSCSHRCNSPIMMSGCSSNCFAISRIAISVDSACALMPNANNTAAIMPRPTRSCFMAKSRSLSFRVDGKMFVLQMFGYSLGPLVLDFFRRGAERFISFAVFLRPTHVGGGVGERNPRFRHADEFDGMLRRDRERQRFR